MVEQTNAYYENLQGRLKSLATARGYTAYFESWSPADITDEEVVIESLKNMFVKQTIDTRIESALPLLARIQQQGTDMKEANIFEAWVESLSEGTWQTPDTPEKQTQLVELMSQDLPVGADATNATEQLYDLLGDDELFDQLEALAEQDANADARQVIYDRMQMLSDNPDVRAVIDQLQIDPAAEMNPAEPTDAEYADTSVGAEPSGGVQGTVGRLAESRMMDEGKEALTHILDRFRHEVRNFEQGGDLDDDLYDALFDYYCDCGDMPYGVQKAREGDPREWVAQNLESHLRGGGIIGGTPDEDYGVERESVMHGDYAEEAHDPMTQTEDPAGTLQPDYPEYEDPLSGILKSAGVPAEERPAPEYNHSDMEEGTIGAVAGEVLAPELGPLAAPVGSAVQDALTPDEAEETDECDTSPLQGQYGHSGKMKPVSKDLSFLDRLKELSGLKRG